MDNCIIFIILHRCSAHHMVRESPLGERWTIAISVHKSLGTISIRLLSVGIEAKQPLFDSAHVGAM